MNATESLQLTTPTERELVLTRVFDAPCHLVFDAFTKPELIRRWYGPIGWVLAICEIDLRVGGGFRYVSPREGKKDIVQRGVYREVVRAERLVYTESWEDWDPGEVVVTLELT